MSIAMPAAYFYPNNMGRIVLLAMEEVLGRNSLNMVLERAGLHPLISHFPPNNFERQFHFETLGSLQACLETIYGSRSGRGLALRSGRSCFKYGLREFGPLLGLTDTAFRLLPLPEKISRGTHIFAETFNRFSDQQVRVNETKEVIAWQIDRCPVCWGRQTEQPTCHLAVGILDEALYWVSSGKHFRLQETGCIAQGDSSCTIEIIRQPFE
jgi:hypothetical protein